MSTGRPGQRHSPKRPLHCFCGLPGILAFMNATPLLGRILGALKEHHLKAVLIGNAAAAIHGAPVTTLGFDFMFRATPANLQKLKAVARSLGAMILRAYYPVSKFYRVVDDATGLQADFMPAIHGVKSFAGLRSRAVEREIDGQTLLVASLGDIIASKKATGRQQKRGQLAALKAESERQMEDLIRRRLALPLEKRMNFLRKRLPGGGSCL